MNEVDLGVPPPKTIQFLKTSHLFIVIFSSMKAQLLQVYLSTDSVFQTKMI